jgi:hypothetical protein
MRLHRIGFAIAVLAACTAASAQQVTITQSGSNDSVSVEQTGAVGATAIVNQFGGSGNQANLLQANTGPGATSATLSQQATFGSSASITQVNVTGITSTLLTQSGGIGSSANLTQADSANAQINAFQSGSNLQMFVQQISGSSTPYIRTSQLGTNSGMTVMQGQPGAPIMNSQARVIQSGDANQAFTLQAGGSNLNAYTSQGANSMPGYYYSNQAGGYIEVDRTVPAIASSNSAANVVQNGGSNHTGYILQYGSSLIGYISQAGQSNTAGILQTGTANYANIVQVGTGDYATVSQRSVGAYANLSQSGAGNTAVVKQR